MIKYKCPNCGDVHDYKKWNEFTADVFDDGSCNGIAMLIDDIEENYTYLKGHYFACPTCREETAFEKMEVVVEGVFILVSTDGYSIEHTKYDTKNEARDAMKKAYDLLKPKQFEESCEEMSYVSDNDAMLYDNGNDVYVWQIIEVNL